MIKVSFYNEVIDEIFKYAVIVSTYNGKLVFCKHKQRTTFECPGGHREIGENILDTAKRELFEETGAIEYKLKQICAYSVYDGESESFGMLYYADIMTFGQLPDLEIERIEFFNELPNDLTYPQIQPKLIEKALN